MPRENERLSAHFTLDEMIVSETAARRGLDNTPDRTARRNLVRLAATMEEVRNLLGSLPILITSGYRSPEVNIAVGGAANSAHITGLACDFYCPGFGTPLHICRELEPHMGELEVDQLIHEFGQWVHLGLAIPRFMALTIDRNGTRNGFY